jgi:hypothetical protein
VNREERLAQNETLFRQVNERLLEVSARLGTADSGPEFVCECSDETCTERIRLSVAEYEQLRSNPRQFVVIAGHEAVDVERVVSDRGSYRIVEKVGAAGVVADDTDPLTD